MASLNKRKIDGAEPGSRDRILWDRGPLPGFGLKITPKGRKVFILDTRINGTKRRITLGKYGPLTLDEARKRAAEQLRDIASGVDPTAAKREARKALTVSELCDKYLEAAAAGLVATRFGRPKKASTVAIDRGLIGRHIKPTIGNIRIGKLSRTDVQRMIDEVAAGKTATDERTGPRGRARVTGGRGIATRTAELFGGIWTWGSKRGHTDGPSPTTGTDRFRGQPIERRMTATELKRLGNTLEKLDSEWHAWETRRAAAVERSERAPRQPKGLVSPQATSALRLIALTGLRPGEASGLRWEALELDRQTLTLADSKTGRGARPLGSPAVDLIAALPRIHDEWVFPATRGDGSASFKKAFATVFAKAKVDATPYALRKTFASIAGDLGYSDGTIGDLLGHARQGVTAPHYIRRIDAVLVAAADTVSEKVKKELSDTRAHRP